MRTPSILIVSILSLLLATGCESTEAARDHAPSANDHAESEVRADMEQSIRLLREAGQLDTDSAQGAMETLVELGIASIKEAELVSNDVGAVLQIVDTEDNMYYLGFGGLGYLEIVRRDSPDGEIIYAPME